MSPVLPLAAILFMMLGLYGQVSPAERTAAFYVVTGGIMGTAVFTTAAWVIYQEMWVRALEEHRPLPTPAWFAKWLLPNALSAFRLLAAIGVVYCAIVGAWTALFVLVVTGYLSDLLDGPIARRFNVVSQYGKEFDLSADVLFDWAIVVGMFFAGEIGWWFAAAAAVAVLAIRLPTFVPRPALYRIGTVLLPVWGGSMLWLLFICTENAFGADGRNLILALAAPIALLVGWLKRERIMTDLAKFRRDFLKRPG